jgi:hypothetical protein
MELKLEWVLVFAISVIITGAMVLEVDSSIKKNNTFTKELEFTNTTFTEVDTKRLHGRAYGTYGIHDNGVLSLENLVYFTDSIKYLIADKGDYVGDVLNLEGNIILEEKQGYHFSTQKASYHQLKEVLNAVTPFVATQENNSIEGDTLVYYFYQRDNALSIMFSSVSDSKPPLSRTERYCTYGEKSARNAFLEIFCPSI